MKKLIIPLFTSLLIMVFAFINNTVSGQTVIYSEGFNYPTGQIPPDWVLDAIQAPPWSVNSSQMAGGEAPELALGYSMAAGLSRLISAPVNVDGQTALMLKYKQYLINYQMDWGEIIGLDITFDGGTNWEVLWEQPLGTMNIPQNEFKYYFNVPAGATEMKFAFRYEGNSNAINWWLIDDISIETVVNNDLICTNFTGMAVPVVGTESAYSVEVTNGGNLSQANYTVKLMKEGGTELATVAGESIAFAEKKVYQLPWTPATGETGNSFIYAYIEFAGDEKPENNQSENLNVTVQPDNIVPVSIGSGVLPVESFPYNFFSMFSITQTLYYPEEIGSVGDSITAILYNNQFDDDLQDVQIQVLMGETSQAQLNGEWIDPSLFTTVFYGMVSFNKGPNQTLITLNTPYKYHGGNLVIYSNKSYDVGYIFGPVFMNSFDQDRNRSRAAETDGGPFDPMIPPTYGYDVGYYPNITLFTKSGGTSVANREESSMVNLFPNPANDMMFVQADETILGIRMSNVLGQEVYNATVNDGSEQYKINTGSFEPGLYLVQVRTAKGITTQRALISR